MTSLKWDASGERFFDTGVDHGTLYVEGVGVAWPGLVSVEEDPTGGEAQGYYFDGVKYLNLPSSEEFSAKIEAYSAPQEFNVCDGIGSLSTGLFITQQRRQAFDFAYRTMIGNDIDGPSHGYKIHVIYNALASPSSFTNQTTSNSPVANTRSWTVTTLPTRIDGKKPSSHLIIDSRFIDAGFLSSLEDQFFGSDSNAPILLTFADVLAAEAAYFD